MDVGAGNGLNLQSLSELRQRIDHVIAVEPNPECFPALQAAATAAGLRVTIIRAVAEDLSVVPDGCADAVLCTFTLCSVAHPEAVLSEACRILRPGGLLLFIEHVKSPRSHPLTWATQYMLFTPWLLLTGGCNLTRCTEATIRAACGPQGFDAATLEVGRFCEETLIKDAITPGAWLAHLGARACRWAGLLRIALWLDTHSHVTRPGEWVPPVWMPLIGHVIAGSVAKAGGASHPPITGTAAGAGPTT
jgi:SAM-dependent methyltransferase